MPPSMFFDTPNSRFEVTALEVVGIFSLSNYAKLNKGGQLDTYILSFKISGSRFFSRCDLSGLSDLDSINLANASS